MDTPTSNSTSPAASTTDPVQPSTPNMASNKKRLWIVIGVAVAAAALFAFRSGLLVAATVNGQPISRLAIVRQLEQEGGQEALESLITYTLIEQEAEAKGVAATDEDVAAEMQTIDQSLQAQGQTLDQALAAQGLRREDVEAQIRVQKTVEKLVGSVEVTDEEVNTFMETNKENFPEGVSEDELRSQVRQQIEQEKRNEAAQQLIADLRAKADIGYYGVYRPAQPALAPTPPAEPAPQE